MATSVTKTFDTLHISSASPRVYGYCTVTGTRTSNSVMRYSFAWQVELNSTQGYLGNAQIDLTFTVGSTSKSITAKSASTSWSTSGSSAIKASGTVTIDVTSTSASDPFTAEFASSNWKSASVSATIGACDLLYTKCTAPTSASFTVDQASGVYIKPNAKITVTWSGAASGTNNTIAKYWVLYLFSSTANQTPTTSNKTGYVTVTSTATSGSKEISLNASDSQRGQYLTVSVVAVGSAGSSYASSAKLATPSTYKINVLPSVPTLSASVDSGTKIKSTDISETLEITGGKTYAAISGIYYLINDTARTSLLSSGDIITFNKTNLEEGASNKYTFYTQDALGERSSSSATYTISRNTAPSASNLTVSTQSYTANNNSYSYAFNITPNSSYSCTYYMKYNDNQSSSQTTTASTNINIFEFLQNYKSEVETETQSADGACYFYYELTDSLGETYNDNYLFTIPKQPDMTVYGVEDQTKSAFNKSLNEIYSDTSIATVNVKITADGTTKSYDFSTTKTQDLTKFWDYSTWKTCDIEMTFSNGYFTRKSITLSNWIYTPAIQFEMTAPTIGGSLSLYEDDNQTVTSTWDTTAATKEDFTNIYGDTSILLEVQINDLIFSIDESTTDFPLISGYEFFNSGDYEKLHNSIGKFDSTVSAKLYQTLITPGGTYRSAARDFNFILASKIHDLSISLNDEKSYYKYNDEISITATFKYYSDQTISIVNNVNDIICKTESISLPSYSADRSLIDYSTVLTFNAPEIKKSPSKIKSVIKSSIEEILSNELSFTGLVHMPVALQVANTKLSEDKNSIEIEFSSYNKNYILPSGATENIIITWECSDFVSEQVGTISDDGLILTLENEFTDYSKTANFTVHSKAYSNGSEYEDLTTQVTIIILNLVPTISYRKNALGINSSKLTETFLSDNKCIVYIGNMGESRNNIIIEDGIDFTMTIDCGDLG